MKKLIGIYSIRNIIDNKVYVGSSKNIHNRWNRHRYDLKNNRMCSPHLQNAWNKYGKENFIFSVLILCKEEDLIKEEKLWILNLNSINPTFGYNSFLPDDTATILMRKIVKKKRIPVIRKRGINCADVVCINVLTKEVFIKNSFIIEQEIGLKSKKLFNYLKYWKSNNIHSQKSYKGWLFIKATEYNPTFDYCNYLRPRKERVKKEKVIKEIKPYSKRNIKRTKIVAIKLSDSSEVEFSSIQQCITDLNLKKNKVYDIIGKDSLTRSHKGYSFRKI